MPLSLKETAYNHVRGKLLSGDLPAGTHLSTLQLARELDISNMPVREALNQLHAEGLVDRRPHSGCIVRGMDEAELTELYQLRELLESFAAEECARNMTRKDLGELEDICEEMRALAVAARKAVPGDAPEFLRRINESDIRFHQTLIRAAGNRWVEQTASRVVLLARIMRAQRLPPVTQLRWLTARHYRLHGSILRVLKRGNPEQARALVSAHVLSGNPLRQIEPLRFPGGTSVR